MFPFLQRARRDPVVLAAACLTVLLLAKFLLPLVRFSYPLGYDAGMYRYLFLAYEPYWPPFTLPTLPPWALEHPVGLFILTTPLLKLGLPVDWLIGWIWNLMPVALALVLAWVTSKRYERDIFPWVLAAALCSAAYFDGFAAMYWKTYAALLFMILAMHFVGRLSPWALPFALLTFVTHHQTGLILGLALGSWWLVSIPTHWRKTRWRWGTLLVVAVAGLSLLFYLPHWDRAVMGPLLSILSLQGDAAPAGAFPEAAFYVGKAGLLLALGLGGLAWSLRKERGSVWQMSVLWCAVFILFKLVFYRRFFLQLDFFLLPFAALAARDLWKTLGPGARRYVVPVLLAAQAVVSFRVAQVRQPVAPDATFEQVIALRESVPPDAFVLGLENQSAVVLRGWLPDHGVGGPGLFDFPWTYAQWETFLLGSQVDRANLAARLPASSYVYASDYFMRYYAGHADAFLRDPCFEKAGPRGLHRVVCAVPPSPSTP
jgi:hypothetical protein